MIRAMLSLESGRENAEILGNEVLSMTFLRIIRSNGIVLMRVILSCKFESEIGLRHPHLASALCHLGRSSSLCAKLCAQDYLVSKMLF